MYHVRLSALLIPLEPLAIAPQVTTPIQVFSMLDHALGRREDEKKK